MAFKQIDDAAYAADRPLASALGVRTAGNLAEAAEVRGRAAAWPFPAADPLVMAPVPVGTDGATQRAVYPFLWRKSSPEVSTLRLRAVVENGRSALDVTLGALAGLPGAVVARNLPASTVETTVSGSGRTIAALDLDVSNVPHDTPFIVLLTCDGELSADYEIYGDATYHSGFDSVQNHVINLHTHSSDGWYSGTGSPAAWADNATEPWVIEFGRNISAFSKQPDYNDNVMDRRLGIRFSDHEIFFWPPMEPDTAAATEAIVSAGAGDWHVIRRACGYVRVYGLEVQEIIGAAPDLSSGYHVGAPASAATARALYAEGERLWAERARCVAGSAFQPTFDNDPDATGLDTLHRNPALCAFELLDAFGAVGAAHTGGAPAFLPSGAAGNWTRTRWNLDVLFCVTCFPRGADPLAYVALRASAGASSGAYDVSGVEVLAEVRPHPTKPDPGNPADFPGTWITHLYGTSANSNARGRHALAGCYPEGLWPHIAWNVQTVDVLDDTPGNFRVVELEARVESWRDARRLIFQRAAVFAFEAPANWPDSLGVAP